MTTYSRDASGLHAALAALGDTANTIANTLLDRGHTGARGDGCDCPIAAYLRAVFGDVHVEVLDEEIYVGGVVIATPDPVRAFIQCFDTAHEYPELCTEAVA
jgi:hypothetical protein